jgi:hypothetical protein
MSHAARLAEAATPLGPAFTNVPRRPLTRYWGNCRIGVLCRSATLGPTRPQAFASRPAVLPYVYRQPRRRPRSGCPVSWSSVEMRLGVRRVTSEAAKRPFANGPEAQVRGDQSRLRSSPRFPAGSPAHAACRPATTSSSPTCTPVASTSGHFRLGGRGRRVARSLALTSLAPSRRT